MDQKTKTLTYSLERDLPGPIERVWDYLTRAELMATWLGRGEVGPVGSFVKIVQDDEAPWPSGNQIIGDVIINDPPHVLEYTWRAIGPDGADEAHQPRSSVVRFELEEKGEEVRLRITHSGLTEADGSLVNAGWRTHLEFMVDKLTGRVSEDFLTRFRVHHPGPIPGVEDQE